MDTIGTACVEESDARISDLLDRVERGEEVTISRGDRAVARLVAADAAEARRAAARAAVESLGRLRAKLAEEGVKPFTIEEIVALRHEGHRY